MKEGRGVVGGNVHGHAYVCDGGCNARPILLPFQQLIQLCQVKPGRHGHPTIQTDRPAPTDCSLCLCYGTFCTCLIRHQRQCYPDAHGYAVSYGCSPCGHSILLTWNTTVAGWCMDLLNHWWTPSGRYKLHTPTHAQGLQMPHYSADRSNIYGRPVSLQSHLHAAMMGFLTLES